MRDDDNPLAIADLKKSTKERPKVRSGTSGAIKILDVQTLAAIGRPPKETNCSKFQIEAECRSVL
jgi:hypothetical protein